MEIRDTVIRGAIIGLLADAVKLIVNYLAYSLGFTQVVFWRLVASNFLPAEFLETPSALLVGAVADLTITAALGVLFLYLISYVGSDYLWIKSIGYAMVVWVTLFGTLLGPQVEAKLPQSPSGVIVTIVAHLAFGVALAFFIWLLLPKELTDGE